MASYGLLGAIAGALPAVALVLSYELLMWLIRSRSAALVPQPACAPEPASAPAPDVHSELNGTGHAALERYAAELAAGELPSMRRIQREMHLGQPRAQQVRQYLVELAAANNSNLGPAESARSVTAG